MVVDTLIEILSPLVDNKVYRQGSFTEKDKYPKLFITFWENETTDGNHYDNDKRNGVKSIFDVNVYGSDTNEVYKTLENAIKLLKEHKFIVDGTGEDRVSDEKTHIGRGITAIYYNYMEV